MSFIPAFEIGLWNAWMFMVLLFAAGTVPLYIDKGKMEKWAEGEPTGSELNKTTKIANAITHIIVAFTLIYSIFLPLKLDTFLFFAGLPIYLLALVWFLCLAPLS